MLIENNIYSWDMQAYYKHIFQIKKGFLFLFLIIILIQGKAQYTDTSTIISNQTHKEVLKQPERYPKIKPFPYKSFIAPVLLITYGVVSLENHTLLDFNENIKEEIWSESPHRKIRIDNFLQFAPAVAVYGLNIAGIKGKNNYRDLSLIYLMSNVILNATVYTIKKTSFQTRPDGSSHQSFPSGHTAEAFASAEFLRQEYKDVSPWYGIAGYAVAATTGVLRIYNNRHWVSDVVAGAGIGLASTRLAYWLYPGIKRMFFKNKPMNTFVMPYYQDKAAGISMVHYFK